MNILLLIGYILLIILIGYLTLLWFERMLGFKKTIKRIILVYLILILFSSFTLTFFYIPAGNIHNIFKQMNNYWMLIISVFIVIIIPSSLIIFIFDKVFKKNKKIRNNFFQLSSTIVLLFSIAFMLYGTINSFDLKLVEYNINSNKNINETKIALISDTHFGASTNIDDVSNLVKTINENNVDILIYAGDIFDNNYDEILNPIGLISELKKINTKYGSYAVFGNHDINEQLFLGTRISKKKNNEKIDTRMNDFLKNANIKLLEDETYLVNNSINLIGRCDVKREESIGRKRLDISEFDINNTYYNIVIDHEPINIKQYKDYSIDLVLSGHTHNGQIFPGNLVTSIMWDNSYGYKQISGVNSIVTSGYGLWGPKFRVGTHSEVVFILLKK